MTSTTVNDRKGLQIADLGVRYGRKMALTGFFAHVRAGHALAVAGTNGAGKSSLMGALAGLLPSVGRVEFNGNVLAASVPLRLAAGIRLVPELGKIYPTMTTLENLIVSDRIRGRVGIDDVYSWFPRLAERRRTLGGNLSGGEQQMLAIGMAILGTPRVLLLDEPTLGLSVPVIQDLVTKLGELRRELDLTVLVAESDATWLSSLTDSVVVIDRGHVVAAFDSYSTDTLRHVQSYMSGLETLEN